MHTPSLPIVLCAVLMAVVLGFGLWMWRHQRLLARRAWLMREAIHNRDFTFRLPVRGLLFGERALQETLNDMGGDIKRLMSQNEVESWQRLTRVLTHEIMNAVAPISSISQAYLTLPQVKGTPLEEGIRAIHDTCGSLSVFVDSYRKMAQLQVAAPCETDLGTFVEGICALWPGVEWHTGTLRGMTVMADANMLRQVMVNLVKNAVESGARRIDIRRGDSAQHICVSNDGAPIPPDVAQEIFVPFFTTKPSGSGIGLSLSRQMMVAQGGDLRLAATPMAGYATTFLVETGGEA